MTDVVALAAELVSLESPTGAEGPAVDFVARWLVSRGWNVTVQEVTDGRGNVWASRAGGGVTFSTHLDTVPPFVRPDLRDDRLYGRGACDAKGIAAAMLVAAERLAARGEDRVDLLFVVGEEHGSDGARAANRLPATSRFLIFGEPTESKLATGARGSLRVTLRTKGRAAHSAYPDLGQSAIVPMLAILQDIQGLPLPTDEILGATTVNVGTIKGGTEANVIPDACEAELMFRLAGDVEQLKRVVEGCVTGRAEIGYGSYTPPAPRCHTVPGFATAPVAYATDVPLLDRWGTPLLFGPGSIHVAHTAEEYIEVRELTESVDAYERLAGILLAT
ncbi:MAG: M20/M25/M40 family metallo-hydrolase [Gemmatimonadales bacterium]|nr:M20/M25/M40 family metallo-hydrolase [Gemmatimonadales bacterium]